jgi:hypothetical protein
MSSKPTKTTHTRKILTDMVGELVSSIKNSAPIQQVKAEIDHQTTFKLTNEDNSLEDKTSSLEQAMDWFDSLQGKSSPQLTPSVAALSPWFGTAEKRLTGLSSLTLFTPIDAKTLADKNHPLNVQHYWQVVNTQSDVIKEQLQRKIDRLTGVRAKVDEWETQFPEDE